VRLLAAPTLLRVLITDHGGGDGLSLDGGDAPDLEAKLAGLQSPRGWGLFLIRNMVDRLETSTDGQRHTVELIVHTDRETNASQPV